MKKRLEELCNLQRKKLLRIANEIVPYVTSDDILQPNDFEELENHPVFRYEEGVLQGLETALSAILAYEKEVIYERE